MKKLRWLGSLLLVLVLTFGMTGTALAADTAYTITVNNNVDGYKYIAYQIFAGDLSEETVGGVTTTTLSNITFGAALSETDQTAVLSSYADVLSADEDGDGHADYASSAAGLAAALGDGRIAAAGFAESVAALALTIGTSSGTASPYKITVTGAGYYLVKNTVVPDGNYAYSDYILEVVKSVSVDPKDEVPSAEKTVADINDSTETNEATGQTSADYDIGDSVPFTLTAALPGDYTKYDTYQLIFHDVMDAGLTFNSSSVVVTVATDGTTYTVDTGCYKVEIPATGSTALSDGCSFEVQIADTNSLTKDGNSIPVDYLSTITVNYNAELNGSAVIGNDGNKNTMHIEYSNNPNWDGTGEEPTGETPDDTVVVFTYKLTVNKFDEDGTTALKGAGFTLYKFDADAGDYVAVGSEVKGTDLTTFTWTGIDDGRYKLAETTVPAGYNKMADMVFYVVAEHSESGITSLRVCSDAAGMTVLDAFTATFDAASIVTNVVNEKGSNLPSTGGIGTTIFYVIGGVMAAGAAILLVTRRRMGKTE
ncbi:MAG: isopeptide-forming domain-containing fimbrial protein [Clostridiales bacterium]|nr:isopeptide-forming domain-containing fimbrial protein [Clostridiales bacterium]